MTILYNTQTAKTGQRFNPQYLVDGQPGTLPDYLIELAIVEAERPQTLENEVATSDWIVDTEQREYRQEWTVRELTKEEIAPATITRVQGLVQLELMGKTAGLNALIAAMPAVHQIAFNSVTYWDRNTELLRNIADQLGFTDDDLLNFFISASKIKL